MYVLLEVPQEFGALDERCKRIVESLAAAVTTGRETLLESNGTALEDGVRSGKLYLVRDGAIGYSRGGKLIAYFEAGDLVGMEEAFSLSPDGLELSHDFAIEVTEYDKEAFTGAALATRWAELLGVKMSMYLTLLTASLRSEHQATPDIRHYKAGEVIIRQDSIAGEVFTMVEGHADVFVDEVKVGEVLKDEIFGALAALTGTPRTASVVAPKASMVLALRKENFVDLLHIRPATSVKLVEDMARTIVALNKEVVSHKLGKT